MKWRSNCWWLLLILFIASYVTMSLKNLWAMKNWLGCGKIQCVHIWWSANPAAFNRRSHKSQFFNWIYFKKMRTCNVLAYESEMIDSVNCLTCDNLKTFRQRKLSCELKETSNDENWRVLAKKKKKTESKKNGQFCNESYKHLFLKT